MKNDNLYGLQQAQGEWYLIGFKDNFVVSIDGGHSDIAGTAEALKLYNRIFGSARYEGVTWRAAYLTDVPNLDVPINEEAANICRQMVERVVEKRSA